MKPYISTISIYADGYSSATIKCEQGELKTIHTQNPLTAEHPDFGHERQIELVLETANKFIASFN